MEQKNTETAFGQALGAQIANQVAALARERERSQRELPRALMPWGAYLELFPREIVSGLGPLLQRLDLVIGPLRVQGRKGEGEPDGFRGMVRRGTYDRLLLSEWLLLEEFPEEFTRRAVMVEHGFLELARQEPMGARTSVALFDAGPNQQGSPRIAHLAALIVLARRAEAAGAGFQWGVLQQPVGSEHTDVTAGTILELLAARSSLEASDEEISCWRQWFGSNAGADDLWIIGGGRLNGMPAAKGAAFLQVTDPVSPEASYLQVQVIEKGRVRTSLQLELPEESLGVRLLRDPFQVRTAEPGRSSNRFAVPSANLLFTGSRSRLIARSGKDHLLVYPLPNSPHEDAGKPKVYRSKTLESVLAAGRVGKSYALVTMTQEPDLLELDCVGPNSDRIAPIRFALPSGMHVLPPESADPLTPCFYLPGAIKHSRWLVVIGERLLYLQIKEPSGGERPLSEPNRMTTPGAAVTVEMEHVRAASSTEHGCCFAGKEASGWALMSHSYGGERWIHSKFDSMAKAYFGYGGVLAHPEFGLAAIEETERQWKIFHKEGMLALYPALDDRVVGVVALAGKGISGMGNSNAEPGLIVLQKDLRTLYVVGRNWVRKAPLASSHIAQITANPYGPEIAYLTVQGELVVYSLEKESALYRLETRPMT